MANRIFQCKSICISTKRIFKCKWTLLFLSAKALTMHSIMIALKIFQDFVKNTQIMTRGSDTTLSDFLHLNEERRIRRIFLDWFLTEHSQEQSRKHARNFSSSDRSASVFHNSSLFVRVVSNRQSLVSSIVEGFDEIKHVFVERRVFKRLKFVDIIKNKKTIRRCARNFPLSSSYVNIHRILLPYIVKKQAEKIMKNTCIHSINSPSKFPQDFSLERHSSFI